MKNAHSWILLLLGIMLVAGCKKQNDGIVISGYTARDESGNLVGTPDTTDWKTDRPIPSIVLNTFNTTPYQTVSGASDTHFCSTISAYPNPSQGIFTLFIENSCYTVYASQYLIVNKDLTVVRSFDFEAGSGGTRNAVDVSFLTPGLYRIYYVFREPNGTIVAQGYGDIQKQ